MRLYALTLACLMLLVSLTAAGQPRRAAGRVAESTPTPEEAALQRRLDARVRALWREGEEGFFPRRTRIEQLKISDKTIDVYFSDGFGSLSSDEATQERLEALLGPELGEGYQEVPLRFFLRQMSLEALRLRNELNGVIQENWKPGFEELFPARTSLTDLEIVAASDVLRFRFSPSLSWMPLRPALQDQLEAFFRPLVAEDFKDDAFSFYVGETPIEALMVHPLDPYAPPRVQLPEGPPLVRLAEPAAPVPHGGTLRAPPGRLDEPRLDVRLGEELSLGMATGAAVQHRRGYAHDELRHSLADSDAGARRRSGVPHPRAGLANPRGGS